MLFAFVSIVLLVDYKTIVFMQVSNQVTSAATLIVLGKEDMAPSTSKDESTGANGNGVMFSAALVLTCNAIGLCTFMTNSK